MFSANSSQMQIRIKGKKLYHNGNYGEVYETQDRVILRINTDKGFKVTCGTTYVTLLSNILPQMPDKPISSNYSNIEVLIRDNSNEIQFRSRSGAITNASCWLQLEYTKRIMS